MGFKEVAVVELLDPFLKFFVRISWIHLWHFNCQCPLRGSRAARETRHNSRLSGAASIRMNAVQRREDWPKPVSDAPSRAASRAVNITIEIPGVILGVIEASQTRVAPADAELASEMDAACERMRRELSMQQVAELAPIHAVRAMFRAWGVYPARYRPSAEALLRRGGEGARLYRVSNVVDINKLRSIQTPLPYGRHDPAAITFPL